MRVELIPGGGPLHGLLKQSQTLLDVLELRVGKAEIRGDGGQVDGEVMASANVERLLEQLRGPLGISAQKDVSGCLRSSAKEIDSPARRRASPNCPVSDRHSAR